MPKTETIDLTPTWRSVVDILVEVAAHGETKKARDEAREELRRMATLADKYVTMQEVA